jgi:hypothetical protein
LEIHQHLGSLKHVINIIMWIRDMRCYTPAPGRTRVSLAGLGLNPRLGRGGIRWAGQWAFNGLRGGEDRGKPAGPGLDGAGFWPIAKQEQGNPSPIFKYFFSYN